MSHEGRGAGQTDLMVGATLASAYKFHTSAQESNSITFRGAAGASGLIGPGAADGGWSVGETGFFGFKFTSGADTHFGWGELNISGSPIGSGYTILRAYYETTPGASIKVGDTEGGNGTVPEPSTLAMFALGAAGVTLARRRRKQQQAEVA